MVHAVFVPKASRYPAKYARRLNSVLSGSSYRAKTPAFHDPITLKNTKHPKNQFRPLNPEPSYQQW